MAVEPTTQDTTPVFGTDIASLPREDRRSVSRTARFIWDQYNSGLARRQHHAVAWTMVESYMRGIHYFKIRGSGFYQPIPPKDGEIRAVTPVMKSRLRHTLGFMLSNDLGLSTIPVASSSSSLYSAERAHASLTAWIDDANVHEFRDEAAQYLLTQGTVGHHRVLDPFRENVFMKALPGSELFPIPYDARSPSDLHGLIHASLVTKQWLELQDETIEQQTGQPPARRMADKADDHNFAAHVNFPMSVTGPGGGRFNGALAITVWMKETPQTPGGEYMFMLGEEMFRHAVGIDEQTQKPRAALAMPKGEIPVEIVYWDKNPLDFWAKGLAEALISAQASSDRHATYMERNARENRPLNFYRQGAINAPDAQEEVASWIPWTSDSVEPERVPPILHFDPKPAGRDTLILSQQASAMADEAAGFRSGIVFGESEGRVESGPATSVLAQNAMSSLIPPFKRIDRAWKRTLEAVLDLLPLVWPDEKIIRLTGPNNIGREIKILKSQIPPSSGVIIQPTPMVPGGKNAIISMLFQLKQMPGPDGRPGSEISPREFRKSLSELGVLPPGLSLVDRPSARIETRINLLIGDTQKPAIKPSEPGDTQDRLVLENHRIAVDMLKDAILDDAYVTYSPDVQLGLLKQLEFHRNNLIGAARHPDGFDDDLERSESDQMESFFALSEAALDTQEGEIPAELLGV